MGLSKRLLELIETPAPALARALGTPPVRGSVGERHGDKMLWRSSTPPRALVVYLTGSPGLSRWLAGSIANRLSALVLVRDPMTHRLTTADIENCRFSGGSNLSESAPTVVVGEADAASAAIELSVAVRAIRLALLYPTAVRDFRAASESLVPTTLVQAAATGDHRADVVALDSAWRRAGIAVRETEYSDVDDGWARYPRVTKGSGRALDDLIGFLDRGMGQASTFDVIPGWDLR